MSPYATYCSFCRFPFEADEWIVTSLPTTLSSPIRFCGFSARCPRRATRVALDGCIFDALHFGCATVGFLPMQTRVTEVMRPTMIESASRQQQRRQWLTDAVAQGLATTYGATGCLTLPLELWRLVGAYLYREYATLSVQTQYANRAAGDSRNSLRLQSPIWARYMSMEGTRYVAGLSNDWSDGAELIWDGQREADQGNENEGHLSDDSLSDDSLFNDMHSVSTSTSVSTLFARRSSPIVYLWEDAVGIRKVLVGTTGQHDSRLDCIAVERNTWWMTLPLDGPNARLRVETDGLKLRRVRPRRLTYCAAMRWPLPLHGTAARPCIASVVEPIDEDRTAITHMDAIVLNEPATVGISACCRAAPISLHTHGTSRAALAATKAWYTDCESAGDPTVWLFMPIEADERVHAVHVRTDPGYYGNVLIATSKRYALLGPFLPATIHRDWTQCYLLPDTPSPLYFDQGDGNGIRCVATNHPAVDIDDEDIDPETPFPVSLRPRSRILQSKLYAQFFSAASLHNVATIQLCRARLYDLPCVIGMLLTYADGSRACAGQFRPDKADAPVQIDPLSQCLQVRLGGRKHTPIVADMTFDRKIKGHNVYILPWTGRLEWWFTVRRVDLRHVVGNEVTPLSFLCDCGCSSSS